MNEPIFQKRLDGIYDDLNRLSNAVVTMGLMSRQYPENFLEFCLDTESRAEKTACKFRHLLGDFGMYKKEEVIGCVSDAHGIEISAENGITSIRLPRLLPKQKKVRSSEFIGRPLYYSVNKFCEENNITRYKECAVCFVHVYDEALSLGRIRDYDNVEIKNVLNTITAFFLTDDGGLLCDVYHTTQYGPSDCTVVSIMPRQRLPGFIAELKSYPEPVSEK